MNAVKKMLALLLTFAMLLSAVACAPTTEPAAPAETSAAPAPAGESAAPAEPAAEEGKVLNIYCWNEEFQSRFTDYFEKPGLIPEGVKVNFIITPSQDNAYQNALDEALLTRKTPLRTIRLTSS